jgi:hypothetical protein
MITRHLHTHRAALATLRVFSFLRLVHYPCLLEQVFSTGERNATDNLEGREKCLGARRAEENFFRSPRMNRHMASLGAVAALSVAVSSASGQVNLLQNPGFEIRAGWSAGWHAAFVPHSGNYSLEVYSAGLTEYPHVESDRVPVTPGFTYDASVWGQKLSLPSGFTGLLKAQFIDSGGNYINFNQVNVVTSSSPTNIWNFASVQTTAPANAVSMVVQLGVLAPYSTYNADVVFDDASLTVVPQVWLTAATGTGIGTNLGSVTT